MRRPSPSPSPLPLLLTFLVLAVPAHAQSRLASLSGEVVDDTGARIPGAVVTVRDESMGTERRLPAPAGAYRVDDLAPGEYQVSASSSGFAVRTVRISLAPGAAHVLALRLALGTLDDSVTVVGTEVTGSHEALRRLPGSVEVIGRDALERSRVATTDEALRKAPGIHVRDEEGLGLRPNIGIRGINPTRSNKILLLEDGIPLAYAPYGDNASYYHPPVDRFQRIEVMKGGAQIAYGPQTIAGLINYVTPTPPSSPSGTLTLAVGNRDFVNGHGSFGLTRGRTGFLVDFMRKQGRGSRDHVRSTLNDLNAKVVRSTQSAGTFTIRGSYYSEYSNLTYSGLRLDEYLAAPRSNAFSNDVFDIDRFGTSVTHGVAIGSSAALSTNVYYSSFRRHWWRQSSNSGQRPNDAADPACGSMANLHTACGNEGRLRQYHTWGVEPRLRLHHRAFGIAGETDAGIRIHVERQDRRQENGDTPMARAGTLVESNLRTAAAYSGFAQNRFLMGGWTVTPGIRVEYVDFERTNRLASAGAGVSGDTTLTQLVPGVGVSHSRGDNITWFAGLHRGFSPPRVEDVISNAGGVIELDPELSWNYEAGVRSTLRPGARIDATVFVIDYENQIVPATLAGGLGALLTNGGQTLHRGLELSAKFDSAALLGSRHNAYVRTAYTYIPVARFEGVRFSNVPGFSSVGVSGNRLPYAPVHLSAMGIGYAGPSGFDVLLEAVRTSDQFADDLNTAESSADGQRGLVPAHIVWNAAVNYDLPRVTLFATVKNLLDDLFIVDRSRGILPGIPRLVQAGVRLRF